MSVHAINKKELYELTWHSERKKSFWRKAKPEGFECAFSTHRYSKKELEEGSFCDLQLLVEDKKVYLKPHVMICFINETITFPYDTMEQATKKAKLLEREVSKAQNNVANPFIDLFEILK